MDIKSYRIFKKKGLMAKSAREKESKRIRRWGTKQFKEKTPKRVSTIGMSMMTWKGETTGCQESDACPLDLIWSTFGRRSTQGVCSLTHSVSLRQTKRSECSHRHRISALLAPLSHEIGKRPF